MGYGSFFAGAAAGAVVGATAGAAGAAILLKAGYTGYVVGEAAKMGAVGSGLIGGAGVFSAPNLFTWIGGNVVGGLIGYGIFKAVAGTAITIGLSHTITALAVGTLTVGGGGFVLLLFVVALGMCCGIVPKHNDSESRRLSSL